MNPLIRGIIICLVASIIILGLLFIGAKKTNAWCGVSPQKISYQSHTMCRGIKDKKYFAFYRLRHRQMFTNRSIGIKKTMGQFKR